MHHPAFIVQKETNPRRPPAPPCGRPRSTSFKKNDRPQSHSVGSTMMMGPFSTPVGPASLARGRTDDEWKRGPSKSSRKSFHPTRSRPASRSRSSTSTASSHYFNQTTPYRPAKFVDGRVKPPPASKLHYGHLPRQHRRKEKSPKAIPRPAEKEAHRPCTHFRKRSIHTRRRPTSHCGRKLQHPRRKSATTAGSWSKPSAPPSPEIGRRHLHSGRSMFPNEEYLAKECPNPS